MRTILLLILVCLLGGLPLQALIYDEDLIGLGRGSGIFLRGDVNGDGAVALSDAVSLLNFSYGGGEEPGCIDAADVDDNAVIDVTDALYLCSWVFLGGAKPPHPGPAVCGTDPSADTLDCRTPSCEG